MSSQLLKDFKAHSPRALSRLISMAENRDDGVHQILSDLYEPMTNAKIIGITGPPGAGKSTLVNGFIGDLRGKGRTVAVIAVDPMSPFTGGAILGDRIRLSDHFNDQGVFIRSLSTRGKLGGLSFATREVVHLCASFGFDTILVETVGVGQSELDIRKIADVRLVVLVPESGDGIQAMKAGILEIADIIVVHKADREGALRIAAELNAMCQMSHRESTPVLTTSSKDPGSLHRLFSKTLKFFKTHAKEVRTRREASVSETIRELLEDRLIREAAHWADRRVGQEKNPYAFMLKFNKIYPPESLFPK